MACFTAWQSSLILESCEVSRHKVMRMEVVVCVGVCVWVVLVL